MRDVVQQYLFPSLDVDKLKQVQGKAMKMARWVGKKSYMERWSSLMPIQPGEGKAGAPSSNPLKSYDFRKEEAIVLCCPKGQGEM